MFDKTHFEITFYKLVDRDKYNMVHINEVQFSDWEILLSLLNDFQLHSLISFIKEKISFSTIDLNTIDDRRNIKSSIIKNCKNWYNGIETFKSDHKDFKFELGIVQKYLQALAVYIIDHKVTVKPVPEDWIDTLTTSKTSRSGVRKHLTKTDCIITTSSHNESPLNPKHLFQLHSLFGLLYTLGFTKNLRIGELRSTLKDISPYDFAIDSTKEYIKKSFNPTKNVEKVDQFIGLVCSRVLSSTSLDLDNTGTFTPKHTISKELAQIIHDIVQNFPKKSDDDCTDQVMKECFDVVPVDENYLSKELDYLIKKIRMIRDKLK